MKAKLTKTQQWLVGKAKAVGYLTLRDFDIAYCCPKSRKSAIERLTYFSIIKATEFGGRFVYCQENDQQTMRSLHEFDGEVRLL